MSLHTRVPMLFEAAQDAQHWVNQVADLLSGTERHLAYRLLRAVLQTLRDTLSPEEIGRPLCTVAATYSRHLFRRLATLYAHWERSPGFHARSAISHRTTRGIPR